MRAKTKKQSKVDKAFTKSDRHTLDDIKLQPWTPERYLAGQSMGMIHPRVGDEGWDQFDRTKMYPGCVKDTVIVIWLCSIPDSPNGSSDFQWNVEDADARPVEAYRVAKKWAKSRGILNADSVEWWHAYGKFAEVVKEASDSMTQPKGANSTNEDAEFPKD